MRPSRRKKRFLPEAALQRECPPSHDERRRGQGSNPGPLEDLPHGWSRDPRARRDRSRRSRWRARLHPRPVRLRQVDALEHHRRLSPGVERGGRDRWLSRARARPPPDLRLPGARGVPLAHRRRKHRVRHQRPFPIGKGRADRPLCPPRRSRRVRERIPSGALGRHEAACRGRPCARREPRRALSRRAVRRARLDHAPRDERRAPADLGGGKEDDSLRDPRHRGVVPARGPRRRSLRTPGLDPPYRRHRSAPPARPFLAALPRVARQYPRGNRARTSDMTRPATDDAPPPPTGPNLLETILLPALTAGVLIAIWHAAVVLTHTQVFPSPLAVVRGLSELARKGVLGSYVRDSLMRVAAGYSLALVLGIPLGIALGWYSAAARAINPVIQFLRPISPLAWIPVAIVLFGVSNSAAIFLIFLASFFPIVVAAMN